MRKFSMMMAALLVSVVAMAQSWSSEWVPKHEFHIDVFGGLSALNYQINSGFAPNATYPIFTDRLGGGAGLGYTLHFNENWGMTLGADFAMYRGSFSAANPTWNFFHVYDMGGEPQLLGIQIGNYKTSGDPDPIVLKETQTLYTVQVPLMAQFMAPLNEQKSNHFYLAIGPRFLFNIAGNFERSFTGYYGEKYASMDPSGAPTYEDGKVGRIIWNYGGRPVSDIESGNNAAGAQGGQVYHDPATQQPMTAAEVQQAIDNGNPVFLQGILGWNDDAWGAITGTAVPGTTAPVAGTGTPGPDEGVFPELDKKGKLNTNLFNVAASGELGFRWGLGNGWGLYTGLYIDYGFLSPIAQVNPADFITYEDRAVKFNEGSLLGMKYDDVKFLAEDVTPAGAPSSRPVTSIKVDREKLDIASKMSRIGAGLKLKLAFGKAAPKKPVQPTIVYVDRVVRDTVVKTNTVTVRDTVVKTNTVIEKEIQVIRDTVTIIKEVPVEIKQTMMELNNTMFDFDKSVIKEVAKGPLNKVVKWLQENPEVKVEIAGHTDSKGSDEYNQRLSEARAKAVYEYFVSQGVDKFRLAYAGYGESRPIATNDTEAGREQNRRVELNIIQ